LEQGPWPSEKLRRNWGGQRGTDVPCAVRARRGKMRCCDARDCNARGRKSTCTGTKVSAALAKSVVVFDFELIDTSLEGAIRGARADEQERLARLSNQLRQLLRNSGQFSLVDIAPIAREAQASHLQACGSAICGLAQRIGPELAAIVLSIIGDDGFRRHSRSPFGLLRSLRQSPGRLSVAPEQALGPVGKRSGRWVP
jgi:hypothetical protein